MDFVVNEWLPKYYRPQTLQEVRALLERFITRFMERGDRLFVMEGSPFLEKILRYANYYSGYYEVRLAIKKFITTILIVEERTILVKEKLELPAQTHARIHEPGKNYNSDEYLFQTAMHTDTKLIITTDDKLCKAMADDEFFKVVLLSEFLNDY